MSKQTENVEIKIQEVKARMHHLKDLRMFKRYQCVLMYLKGRTPMEIADFLVCTVQTVYNLLRAYRGNGLDGLSYCQSPGRPKHLTDEHEKELYQLIIEKKPSDVEFSAEMNWTSFLIRDWIKNNFNIEYTDRGVRKLLRRLGFSYTKPTYTLEKADPKKQEAFIQDFETLKRRLSNE
ncbi:IS630 family transposase [Paenibacillus aceris]|uniref:Transposase n=1 Tax=Paenibacillus aceris TaxID=869555 RepID=A0ABS4I840_9BACL|nr:IS630 family transposase [Paenibacillus aceris]MBP1967099.1 putative transposase [Paenibacillus aceris]NHW35514.1 IS630 family transposase [Paenibacillus aceris]